MGGIGSPSNWNGYVSSPDDVAVEKVDWVRAVTGALCLWRRVGSRSVGVESVELLVGTFDACCLANIEPGVNGLPFGLVAPGERGGRAEIGEGGTKGNPARTESACEDVVFALRMECGRTLSSSSSRSTEARVRPFVSMLIARDGTKPGERWDAEYADGLSMPRMTREAVPISARILTPSAVLAMLTGRLL